MATWTAVPLDPPNDVTTAVSVPELLGCVENVTVKDVAVAEVTAPKAPRLNTTVLPSGFGESKPLPAMTSAAVESRARLARFCVTDGAATIVATVTALPLEPP